MSDPAVSTTGSAVSDRDWSMPCGNQLPHGPHNWLPRHLDDYVPCKGVASGECSLCGGSGVYENPTDAHMPEPLACECRHPDNPRNSVADEITEAFRGAPFGFNA